MKKRLTILRILTVHCDEIIPLVSQACDEELTLMQRLAVRTHLWGCTSCRRFKKQIALLRESLQSLQESTEPVAVETATALSAEARERIRNHLKSSE